MIDIFRAGRYLLVYSEATSQSNALSGGTGNELGFLVMAEVEIFGFPCKYKRVVIIMIIIIHCWSQCYKDLN